MAMEALRGAAKESKFMKFILGGFIALAVGGLVFTDIHGMFTGNVGGTTIATVEDTKIDIRQFDNDFRGFLNQTGLGEDGYNLAIAEGFLQSRINAILRQKAANDLNIMMDNDTIARQIRAVFGPNTSKEQIEMTLRAQGMSVDDLANNIRAQTAFTMLNAMPSAVTNYVPSYVSDIMSKIQNESRSATVLTIPLSNLYESVEITDQDIVNYYNENPNAFTTPETRNLSVGTLSLDDVKDTLPALSQADIREDYNSRIEDFIIPEKRTLIQIQIKDSEKAQAVYEAALKNGDLAEAVKNVLGEDRAPTDAATFEYDALPTELADAAFASSRGVDDIIPPVQSIFGNVVAQITDITEETTQDFASIKQDLRAEMQQNAEHDALYNIIITIEDMIDNGQTYDEIKAVAPLKTSKIERLSTDNFDNKIPESLKSALENGPSLKDEIFTLPAGGVAYPIEIDEANYIFVGVDAIEGGELQALDDVRDDIRATLITQNQRAIAQQELNMITDQLIANSKTLDTVKDDKNGKIRTVEDLKQGDSSTATANLISTADENGYNAIIDGDNAIIVRIDDVKYNDDDAEDMDNLSTIQSTQTAMVDSLLAAYYRDNASIWVNETLLNQYISDRE